MSAIARGTGPRRPHCRRSRNGCLTCKRRKVRCNEERPQCGHCQRLSLQCVWKDSMSQRPSPRNALSTGAPLQSSAPVMQLDDPFSSSCFDFAPSGMDYNPADELSLFQDIYLPDLGDFPAPGNQLQERALLTDRDSAPSSPAPAFPSQTSSAEDQEDPGPFHVPPILGPVENGPKCASMRTLLSSMATASPMVSNSIAAFAIIETHTSREQSDYQQHYDKAADDLSRRFHAAGGRMTNNSNELGYVLATIFFLTYINVGP